MRNALGLAPSQLERLGRIVAAAAIAHDLGKASEHFQEMVRGARTAPQLVRHEALVLWIAWPGQPLAGWLTDLAGGESELLIALAAAVGHHRKFWSAAVAGADSGAGSRLRLFLSHADFAGTLDLARARFGAGPAPSLEDVAVETSRRSRPEVQIAHWAHEWEDRLAAESDPNRLLAAAKAVLIAADVAGSALPRSGGNTQWITSALLPTRDGAIQDVVDHRLDGAPLRPFQSAVGESKTPVTLVRAGCGSGKTLAAYLWAARQHPTGRLWITYPTTGTATEVNRPG
jgi:CRISPR-associated endonuclease/helicase Cas3